MSDLHVGSGLFRPELLSAAIEETNELRPTSWSSPAT